MSSLSETKSQDIHKMVGRFANVRAINKPTSKYCTPSMILCSRQPISSKIKARYSSSSVSISEISKTLSSRPPGEVLNRLAALYSHPRLWVFRGSPGRPDEPLLVRRQRQPQLCARSHGHHDGNSCRSYLCFGFRTVCVRVAKRQRSR